VNYPGIAFGLLAIGATFLARLIQGAVLEAKTKPRQPPKNFKIEPSGNWICSFLFLLRVMQPVTIPRKWCLLFSGMALRLIVGV
jgi:hypothetical protein